MTDDPQQIRDAARTVERLARDARSAQRGLIRAGCSSWKGVGADRYRTRLHDRAREFGSRADDLDELARRLTAHASAVERHERTLSRLVPRPHGMDLDGVVDAARSWQSAAVRS
ncbi:WXG100 family type VII secretion target [Luteipulveratus halotolerans]|uniref:Putative T7SS secretion signal domain-containing protein n=1 Tax=Luteipulveratus halotolerans TaxID=1631356 RepID=A0A0L6CEL1_9MICO|nr:hypothetical protein [Luteipulveratus halotolerans]KNX36000.1 hypothetical protein VV01_00645 [Luteipulveratus halotolerans]